MRMRAGTGCFWSGFRGTDGDRGNTCYVQSMHSSEDVEVVVGGKRGAVRGQMW